MFNPEDPKKIKSLVGDIAVSEKALTPFREQDVELVRKYVGKHYGSEGSQENRPINMIETGVNTYQRFISANNTQVMVDSDQEQLLPEALNLELVMNNELRRIAFDESCNEVGMGALFRMGIMEVGITTDDTPPDGKGNLHDPGHVFTDNVPFSEAFFDMKAKNWEQMRYVGHNYPAPLDWIRENRQFDKSAREKVTAGRELGNQETNLQSISGEYQLDESEFDGNAWLKQVFLPRHQLLLTLHRETVLRTVSWKGPERGPYHKLVYGKVPGNLIPQGIIPLWHDLDDIANRTFCKLADQIERRKTILGVPLANKDDGTKVTNANDGDAVPMDDPKSCQEFAFGGADKDSMAAVMWIKSLWDYFSGNMTALGGLGAMSRTVGQDKLIAGSSSGRIDDMRDRMMYFKQCVLEDVAFWIWSDPVRDYPIVKPVASTEFNVRTVWSPENRMGSISDYHIRVNPFTEKNMTPEERAQGLVEFVVNVLPQLMPAMQQQGIALDTEFIIKELARCTNNPALGRSVIYLNGEQLGRSGEPASMPNNTTRTYERVSRPQPSQIGRDNALMQHFFDGSANADQMGQVAGMAG